MAAGRGDRRWSGAAIDGTDVLGGVELSGTFVELPAGGRAHLLVPVAAGGTRAGILGGPSLALGPVGVDPPPLTARVRFDALT